MIKRILEIKYKKQEAHLGSCLTALPIIEKIFKMKKKNDKFILSSGHAATALYVVLEKRGVLTKKQSETLSSHPHRDEKHQIWASTGSLGHGIGIALGMAIADKKRDVYCLMSDGECAEGSVWEVLRLMKDLKVKNLKIYVNVNGYIGYGKINRLTLKRRLSEYIPKKNIIFTKSEGLKDHYMILTKEEYEKRIR